MFFVKLSFSFFIFFICGAKSFAQQIKLVTHSVDTTGIFLQKEFKPQSFFATSEQATGYLDNLINKIHSYGYIAASLDTVIRRNDTLNAYIYIGEKFVWQSVNMPLQYAFLFNNKNTATNIVEAREKLIAHLENTGHPFAKVYFDSIEINGKNIKATLRADEGYLYKLDSIRTFGEAKISKAFLYNYLNIQPGEIYNAQKLEDIDKRLAELPYLEQEVPWQLTMLGSGFLIDFYLKKKQSNQIDALIGFLPANDQLGGSKLLLTVDANILLRNAFATGETIGVTYQQIQPKSPRLNLLFQKPYLFGSRFGFDGNFNLYKKDSSYLNIDARIGAQYFINQKQQGTIFYQTFRTNMLDVDTNFVKLNKRLPDFVDVSSNMLGVNYKYSNTDYRFNPRKGNELQIEVGAGKKKVKRNNAIVNIKDNSFDYASLYDTVDLSTYFISSELSAAQYFSLGKQSVLKTAAYGGLIHSPNYFRNELFQIGGFKLLRGFDEEAIFASKYGVVSVEYRYLLGLNSYFFVFTDGGVARYQSADYSDTNSYIGAGLGLTFQTKQGLFNLSYAAGKAGNQKLDLRQSKIHFGYVSLF